MSDFSNVDAVINLIANEVIKKANTRTRLANALTLLRNHIEEIELTPGADGRTAYQVAVDDGFVGDQTAWLASLIGAPGAPGAPGANAIVTRTSSTSREVGLGLKTFTYDNAPNLGWVFGQRLRVSYLGNFMEGTVDSVSSTVVTINVDLAGGSGTHAGWTIGIAGAKGDSLLTEQDTYLTTPKKIREGAGPETDYQTKSEVLNSFPVNSPQLEEIEGVATIIQLGLNPAGTSINFQIPEEEFGSLAEPLTDLTINLTLAKKNKITAYVERVTIPTRIDPDTNTDIVWLGDAYIGTVGFVNKMVMKHQTAPTPQNRIIEITNTVVDMTDFGVDTDLKIYLQFDEVPGNEVNFIDSSGYGNNFQAVSGMVVGALPTVVTDPANTPLRATRGGRQGLVWNHITSGNNGAFVGAFAAFVENLVAFVGFTVMFEFEATSGIVGTTAGLVSFCNKTGFGFRIQKSGVDGGTFDNTFEFRINANTSASQRIRSASAYTSNTRIHLAFTYQNGIGLSMYINGVLSSSSTDTLGTTQIDETVDPAFYLGTRNENLTLTGSGPKNGTFMNEFKYLTRRLTLAEIEIEATRLGYL